MKFLRKWWFQVIIVVVIAIVSCASSDKTNDSNRTGTSQTNTESIIVYDIIDLQQMMDALKANALKAEKTYQNKYIQITGKISNFDSDGKYISVEPVDADMWNFDTVMCYITDTTQLDFLLEKAVGDIVTIKGKVKSVGEVIGYRINIDDIS